jgi:predicted AAA+ superfamily ATPase
VPRQTLSAWLSALEASYITFRLPGFLRDNEGMGIPKLYFVDVGMAAFLLGIGDADQVYRDPMIGNLFENMVVADALKCRYNKGRDVNFYYFRRKNAADQDVLEIDLLVKQKYTTLPIEIKCSSVYCSSYAKSINIYREIAKMSRKGCVVYGGETKVWRGEITKFVNFKEIGDIV